jgi:ferredoxin-NADP reductase
MAETGAKPNVPKLQRAVLRAVRAFSTPLLPDDYLELINPLWSTRELRGRIERIDHVTRDAATVLIKPGYRWEGHEAGQYVRIGVDIRGVRHWRAYSLTSEPDRPDGCISITPKLVESGVVSPHLLRHGRPGAIVSLGGVEGDFVLPDPLPDKLLFISAGSGITPIISMLRGLCRRHRLEDAVLIHSARTPADVIFGDELRRIDCRFPRFGLHEQHTSTMGRFGTEQLDERCPDWREREAFVSGPGDMLDALTERWEREGNVERLHMERFQPKLGTAETGDGGTINFVSRERVVEADGTKPILVCGEGAGLELPFGCREGICHTCVGTLRSGRVRDLRNGQVDGQEGQSVRTCINAPEGPIEIEV